MQPWNRQRSGFTLIEMLIVLAVLAAMAAFTLPAMRGPLDKSRLRAAGQQVQAALGRARSLSIRQGVPVEFRYELQGQRWKIERTAASPEQRGMGREPGTTTRSGLSAQPDSAFGVAGANSSVVTVLREGLLPDGLVFDATDSSTTADAVAFTNSFDERLPDSSSISWSPPITFRPNGRSQDAAVTIRGARDFVVTVNIRGLTSAVRYSAPFRHSIDHSAVPDVSAMPSSEATR
ncbi:MAG: prepilin-type N-terminal cleavage/methylation domain-containing protein [Fuerstiella sp.]